MSDVAADGMEQQSITFYSNQSHSIAINHITINHIKINDIL
jgi:hypothetical protein